MRILLRLPALAAVLITLGVSGCASDQSSSKPAPTAAEPKAAVKTKPAAETAKATEGRATWYGPGLYGNKTASGDVLKEGTVIDLAHGAADALDIDDDGTANVSIEVMD